MSKIGQDKLPKYVLEHAGDLAPTRNPSWMSVSRDERKTTSLRQFVNARRADCKPRGSSASPEAGLVGRWALSLVIFLAADGQS